MPLSFAWIWVQSERWKIILFFNWARWWTVSIVNIPVIVLYHYHRLSIFNFLQFVLKDTFIIYNGICVYAIYRFFWELTKYLILCLERACGELHQGTVGNINWQKGSTWKSSNIPALCVFRPGVCKEDTQTTTQDGEGSRGAGSSCFETPNSWPGSVYVNLGNYYYLSQY